MSAIHHWAPPHPSQRVSGPSPTPAGGHGGPPEGRGRSRAATTGGSVLVLVVVLACLLLVIGRDRLQWGDDAGTSVLDRSFRRTTERSTLSYETSLVVDRDDVEQQLTVAGASDVTTAAAYGTVALGGGSPEDRQLQFRVQGRRLFLQHAGAAADSTWAEVDLLETLASSEDEQVGLLGLAVQRPVEFLSMLRGTQSTEEVGTEDIDGIATTHYLAEVSLDAALETPNRLTDVDLLRSVVERIDGDEIELDAWIDDNGKLRQLALAGTLDGGTDYEMVLRISAFGDDVQPELPPDTTLVTPLDLGVLLNS